MSDSFKTIGYYGNLSEACAALEILPPRFDRDGWMRVPTLAERRGRASGAIHLLPDGNGYCCFNWQTRLQAVVFKDYGQKRQLNAVEKAAWDDRLAAMRKECQKLDEIRWRNGETVSVNLVRCAVSLPYLRVHPYLISKRLEAFANYLPTIDKASAKSLISAGGIEQGLGNLHGRLLVVPLYREGWVPTSVSFIDEDGNKCLLKDGRKKGSFWGSPAMLQPLISGEKILGVAEGVATALAVTALYGTPCIAGIDAGNLRGAALTALKVFKGCRIQFFADIDASKTGENAAFAAWFGLPEWARAYLPSEGPNCVRRPGVIVPPFTDADKQLWADLQACRDGEAKPLSDFADYWFLQQERVR